MTTKLAPAEIAALDPYKFMATIGKRVIHPGGRTSTDALLARAAIGVDERVLDVGCGVGTTAIEIARRHAAGVTALDISPIMLERARENVRGAGMGHRVSVEEGDILDLAFPDGSFDVVIAEAVTMFVDWWPRSRCPTSTITTPIPDDRGRPHPSPLTHQRPPPMGGWTSHGWTNPRGGSDMAELHDIKGIGPATAARLAEHGLTSVKRLAKADPDALTAVPGFGPARAAAVQAEARAALAARKPKPSKEPKPAEAAGEPGAAKRLDASNAIEDKKKAPKVPKKKKKRSKKKKKAKKA